MINKELTQEFRYVGFWSRFWASFVDSLFFMALIYPPLYLFYKENFLEATTISWSGTSIFINFILPLILVIVLWKYKDATPGKMLIKARIVDADTFEAPSMRQYFIRYFAYLISFLPFCLGYFWIIWDNKKQGFHDKLSNTVVIQQNKK